MTLIDEVQHQLTASYGRTPDVRQLVRDSSPDLAEFVMMRYFSGRNCSESFTSTITGNGQCLTFNSQVEGDRRDQPYRQAGNGRRNGLTLLVNLALNQYTGLRTFLIKIYS